MNDEIKIFKSVLDMKIKQAMDMKVYLDARPTKLYKTIKGVIEENDIQKILENMDYVCYDMYVLECERYLKKNQERKSNREKTEESTFLGLCNCSDELTHLKQAE